MPYMPVWLENNTSTQYADSHLFLHLHTQQ